MWTAAPMQIFYGGYARDISKVVHWSNHISMCIIPARWKQQFHMDFIQISWNFTKPLIPLQNKPDSISNTSGISY